MHRKRGWGGGYRGEGREGVRGWGGEGELVVGVLVELPGGATA